MHRIEELRIQSLAWTVLVVLKRPCSMEQGVGVHEPGDLVHEL